MNENTTASGFPQPWQSQITHSKSILYLHTARLTLASDVTVCLIWTVTKVLFDYFIQYLFLVVFVRPKHLKGL